MAAGPEQIRSVGVVGLGYWGPKLARCFHQLGALTALCDIDKDRLQMVGKDYGTAVMRFPVYEHMLGAVDALTIATPPETHYGIAKRALLAGRHVFVEKPLATTYREAKDLEEMALARGLRLMTGHTYLYCPGLFHIPKPKTKVRILVSLLNSGAAPSPTSGLKWASLPHAASIALHFLPYSPQRIDGKRGDHYIMADLSYSDGSSIHIEVGDHMGRGERLVAIVAEGISYYFRGNEPSEYITKSEGGFHIDRQPPGEPLLLECQAFLAPDGRVDYLGSRVVQLVESIWNACPLGDFVVQQVPLDKPNVVQQVPLDKPNMELRPTEESDLPLLLAWRQNPLVMRYFVDGGERWEQHMEWWKGEPFSYMVIYEGRPVGEAHFTTEDGVEVGLYIGEMALWGKGIGRQAMSLLLQKVRRVSGATGAHRSGHYAFATITHVTASVHPENRRSQRMFRAVGFQFVKVKEDGYLLFRRELEGPSA